MCFTYLYNICYVFFVFEWLDSCFSSDLLLLLSTFGIVCWLYISRQMLPLTSLALDFMHALVLDWLF